MLSLWVRWPSGIQFFFVPFGWGQQPSGFYCMYNLVKLFQKLLYRIEFLLVILDFNSGAVNRIKAIKNTACTWHILVSIIDQTSWESFEFIKPKGWMHYAPFLSYSFLYLDIWTITWLYTIPHQSFSIFNTPFSPFSESLKTEPTSGSARHLILISNELLIAFLLVFRPNFFNTEPRDKGTRP